MYNQEETKPIAAQISESESVQELRTIAIDMLKEREFWRGKYEAVEAHVLESELREVRQRIDLPTQCHARYDKYGNKLC